MANYPQTPSYGANPYLQPPYSNQYLQSEESRTNQGHMGGHFDNSMNGYGYNRTVPTFSAAAVASGVPPLPIFQSWNQDSMPLAQYSNSQNAGQYSNGYNRDAQSQQHYPPLSQTNYQQHMPQSRALELESGEVEFDANANTMAANTTAVRYGASQYTGNEATGYVDTAQHAMYSGAQEYNVQPPYPANKYTYSPQDPPHARRQQSDSYSPYASPSGPGNIEQPSGAPLQTSYTPGHTQESLLPASSNSYVWPQSTVAPPSSKSNPKGDPTSHNGNSLNQHKDITSQPTVALPPSDVNVIRGKSVAESRKKAQAAILNLWPYDVRYQTYIDEGFKEDIIGRLFDDLKMSRTSPKSGNTTETQQQSMSSKEVNDDTVLNGLAFGTVNAPSKPSKINQDTGAPLAIPTNGNLAPAKVPVPSTSTTHLKTPILSASAKSASMLEKDKALKSKMDALRKSREDRAQKAAAKTASSVAAVAPVVTGQNELPNVVLNETPSQKDVSLPTTNSLLQSPSIAKNEAQLLIKSSTPIGKPQNTQVLQQTPTIPGLFLASSTSLSTTLITTQSSLQSPILANQRKRPVAADFDELPPSTTPFKRPFGQSRNEKPLVIDVSDESDSDEPMDLESIADDSPVQVTEKIPEHPLPASQNYPGPSISNQGKARSPPQFSSAASTPPAIQQAPRGALGRPEILQRKESEIEELKKKIAEAEAKAKRNKARQTPSGARTPRPSELPITEEYTAIQLNRTTVTQLDTSSQVQELIDAADKKIATEQQRLAEAQATETAKAVDLRRIATEQKRKAAESKRILREKMASLEAADEQELAEIERKRAEVAKMEASRQMTLNDKQKILAELQLLGDDEETEGHNSSEEQELNSNLMGKSDSPATSLEPHFDLPQSSLNADMEDYHREIPLAAAHDHTPPSSLDTTISQIPGSSRENVGLDLAIVKEPTIMTSEEQFVNRNSVQTDAPIQPDTNMGESKEVLSADQALEAALQEAVRIEADSQVHIEGNVNMEVSLTPNPVQLAPKSSSSQADETTHSPAYSPVLETTMADVPDRESDDYEPPEATPPSEAVLHDQTHSETDPVVETTDSPPFSPAPPTNIPSAEAGTILDVDFVQSSAQTAVEKTPEELPILDVTLTEIAENHEEQPGHTQKFTPYESPLKNFHAYRFHPQFKQEVPGGLKSVTFSHRINSGKEFCRYELAGGICNDPTCELQHFREIGLPDDGVLTALGSPDEFKGEQRDRFCAGLKEILLSLRVRKIRDFDIIASEIIAHRVKFLGDDSKVLPLEGTTL